MTAGSAVGLYEGEETLREFREDGREVAEDAASSLSMRFGSQVSACHISS